MNIKSLLGAAMLASLSLALTTSCDNDAEALEVQGPKTYDAQYYENLRNYKTSNHEIYYAYYQHWAPLEGIEGSKDPASWGERLVGLPDSIDIVNLWMGIPTAETHPVAYKDMLYCQQTLGTRFVFHADAANYNHRGWWRDENFQVDQTRYFNLNEDRSEEALRAYARWAVDTVVRCGLDGVDWDFEGWSSSNLYIVLDECNKYFGTEGKWAEKLLIADYFGGAPGGDCEPYCDYLISQSYSGQVGFRVTTPSGWPTEKMVFVEAFHQAPTGGQVWNYARYEPATGHKGGCGSYSTRFNYNNTLNGVPYQAVREAIQIMNPAVNY